VALEVVRSFLQGCGTRRCRAIDIGAEHGWMTAHMLQLGSHVVSVEPRKELALAINETTALNCWAERSTVLNMYALHKRQEERKLLGLGSTVATSGLGIEDILFHGVKNRTAPLHIELIKANGDGARTTRHLPRPALRESLVLSCSLSPGRRREPLASGDRAAAARAAEAHD
jgi:hypothetical protein